MAEETPVARAEVLRTRDLMGWRVTDPHGGEVGTVSDLLIGRDGRVRFLAVKRGMFGSSTLVPVDELAWGEGALRLERWTAAQVKTLPSYDADRPLTADALAEMERAHPRYYGPPLPPDAPAPESGTVPLREAKNFKLAKDAPNPRGWTVFGADQERVGTVHDMLVDPVAMKARFLDVDVSDDLYLLDEDRHVAVPMEAVELRDRGEDVWIRGLSAREVAALPAYTGGALDPLVEARVRDAFGAHADEVPALPPPDDRPPIIDETRDDEPPPLP